MDAERRARERAAGQDPGDRAAGWALVAACRRAGDRRATSAALCALARQGDAAAAAEADAWNPWPGPDGPGRTRAHPGPPLRGPVRSTVRRHAVGVPLALVGASPTHAFVLCVPPAPPERTGGRAVGERLVALDLATLAVAWTAETDVVRQEWTSAPAALAGDVVLWPTWSELRALDVRSGAEVGRVEVEGEVTHVLAERDAAALAARSELADALVGVAVEPALRARWTRRRPGPLLGAALARGTLLLEEEAGAELHRTGVALDDGAERAWQPGGGGGLADDGAAVVTWASHGLELRPDPGAPPAWTHGALTLAGVALLPDGVAALEQAPSALVVLERAAGAARWRRALDDDAPLVDRRLVGHGADVVLLATAPDGLAVEGLDAATGAPILAARVAAPPLVRPAVLGQAPGVAFAELVPLPGALLLLAAGADGDLVAARLDPA